MLSDQLFRLIENHAQELTWDAVKRLQSSSHTPSYHELPPDELHRWVYALYHGLGDWLLKRTDRAIQGRYGELGRQRCKEGIPLADVLWALVLTKGHMRESIGTAISSGSALELYREQEIYCLIGRFFDRAMCYTAEAYEREASLHLETPVVTVTRSHG